MQQEVLHGNSYGNRIIRTPVSEPWIALPLPVILQGFEYSLPFSIYILQSKDASEDVKICPSQHEANHHIMLADSDSGSKFNNKAESHNIEGNLESFLSDVSILVRRPKWIHKYFQEVTYDVLNWKKPHINLYNKYIFFSINTVQLFCSCLKSFSIIWIYDVFFFSSRK